MRNRRYRYAPRRKAALKKAQLISARKRKGNRNRKLAIVGAGVVAAGMGAVVLGKTKLRGHPINIVGSDPPQANPSNSTSSRRDWDIGDDWEKLSPNDVVEVTIRGPKALGGVYHRYYGLPLGPRRPTRHSREYKVKIKAPGKDGGYLSDFWVDENKITGVKVGGASNFINSVKDLMEERKNHKWAR